VIARRTALFVTVVMSAAACSGSHASTTTPTVPRPTTTTTASPPPTSRRHLRSSLVTLREQPQGTLPAPVQYPAAAAFASGIRYAGGLDARSSSSAQIVDVAPDGSHAIGQLPVALHDAAGAPLGDALYVFGGGTATGQLDSIVRVAPSGAATAVGTLPSASSDSSAAVVGDTAYVVGGYDGSRWLDTIVAFNPVSGAHVVAHLPTPLRYAAVGRVGPRLLVAGGTTPTQSASTAVYAFDPATAQVTKIGDLPVAIAHAAAVGRGNELVVVGGRDGSGAMLTTITAVNSTTGRSRAAGQLDAPRSDAALVRNGAYIWLFGGRNANGVLGGFSQLVADPASESANVYAHDGAGQLTGAARTARSLVYVPNSGSNTVDVIDPTTMKVINHFAVGQLPQHVTPSWDMKTLYVDNDLGNSLTPIDPATGQPGAAIPVTDPYNLYFTPDGQSAMVVAERFNRLDFRDPHTMQLRQSVPVPCRGVDHMDFTADGTIAVASCEFSGNLVVVDVKHLTVVRTITLGSSRTKPQDVKLSPDGKVFYVADMNRGGVWKVDAHSFAVTGFIPTGRGAHGLYPSRDATKLYVTNRNAGTVSVLDFATGAVVDEWTIPGGSPDMGGVSVDGRVLWLSGRYNAEVYAISTTDGHLLARIPVGRGPHGVCVWPQPGRVSLGHTGVMR
jgi:YVTN family beta-propeller protein